MTASVPESESLFPPVSMSLTSITSAMILFLFLPLHVTVTSRRAGRGCAAPAVRVAMPAGRRRPPSRLHTPLGLRPSARRLLWSTRPSMKRRR